MSAPFYNVFQSAREHAVHRTRACASSPSSLSFSLCLFVSFFLSFSLYFFFSVFLSAQARRSGAYFRTCATAPSMAYKCELLFLSLLSFWKARPKRTFLEHISEREYAVHSTRVLYSPSSLSFFLSVSFSVFLSAQRAL